MVGARPTRTAPICSSARLVLRVMPGVGRRCVHCVIVDVEAVPSTNNARFAPRCTEPRLKAGRAGLKDKLGKLRHFMGGLGGNRAISANEARTAGSRGGRTYQARTPTMATGASRGLQ